MLLQQCRQLGQLVIRLMRSLPTTLALLLIMGCREHAAPDRTAKLEQVRAAAIQRAGPEDAGAIAASTPVLGIDDLPISVVGLRVPLRDGTNTVFVAFQVDYFDATRVEQLASEALIDYTRTKRSD